MDTTARHVFERDATPWRARRLYRCYHMPQLQPTYCTVSMQGLLWAGPFLSWLYRIQSLAVSPSSHSSKYLPQWCTMDAMRAHFIGVDGFFLPGYDT
jgi:hypothetical protein